MAPAAHEVDKDVLLRMQQSHRTYRKLVVNNYLAHDAIGHLLNRTLKSSFDRPFDLLDIGCGDGSMAATTLAGTRIRRYVGIDFVPPVLRLAAGNLRPLGCAVELRSGDFEEVLATGLDPVDVSWMSLSLHHLPEGGKSDFLGMVRAVTRGFLLIYEPTRLEDEDRTAYLERFFAIGETRWTALDADDWQRFGHHVRSRDFPETAAGWAAAGRQAGFSRVSEIYTDPNNLMRAYRFDL